MHKHIKTDFTLYEAIDSMVVGSTEAIEGRIESFVLDSGTFGDSEGEICHGCHANVTLQEMHSTVFTPEQNRVFGVMDGTDFINDYDFRRHAKAVKRNAKDVGKFEYAVNEFRLGHCATLFEYFKVEYKDEYDYQWLVHTAFTKTRVLRELAKVKEFNKTVVANLKGAT